MSNNGSGVMSNIGALGLVAIFSAVSLKIVAPDSTDYIAEKISDKIASVLKADAPTVSDYQEAINELQITLGNEVAKKCKNIAENKDYLHLSEGVSLYHVKMTNELSCLSSTKRQLEM
ncbi:MAG: hypothetical protein COB14_06800 [Alphaproteobacteria bacterium]|nr:MAG: hypothetical protein COB14_06800 [Alphaproteobacteria bacterium]